MAKSEYQYKIYRFDGSLNSTDPDGKITELAEDGWDIQQVFNGEIPSETPQTFALLRRRR